jgi:membrane protein YdbS with pleckstrin-like domain
MSFDREDFLKATRRLKISTIVLICLYAFSFIANLDKLDKQLAAIILASFSIIWLVFKIIIVFRIRFVRQRMNKGAILWQLGVLLVPLLDVILPWIVLSKANKYLSDQKSE